MEKTERNKYTSPMVNMKYLNYNDASENATLEKRPVWTPVQYGPIGTDISVKYGPTSNRGTFVILAV